MRSEARQAGDYGARFVEPARRPSKREAIIEICRHIRALRFRGETREAERWTKALLRAQPDHREVIMHNLEEKRS